jgi:Tfp pilus assembly protein PilV
VSLQAVLSRLRARSNSDEGFTIIEMMVALMIIMIVMTSLVYVMATSLKQVSFSKQRQVASGLVDKTMEQARALPNSMIDTGHDDHDLTTPADSNISVSGSTYTFVPTGETIVHGNQNGNQSCPSATTCQAPLIPHQSTTVLNATTYKVSTYVTNYSGSAGAYRITVIVSWTPSEVRGVSNQVSSQSVIYSTSNGCLSDQTHPFSSPCQPFLYAQSSTGKGAITIGPVAGAGGTPIQGVSLDQAQMQLAQVDSTMQIEQTSHVQGQITTGATTLSVGGTPLSPVGGASATAQSDSDPGTNPTPQPTCPITQSSTSPLQASDLGGSGNGITLSDSSADSGCTVSTAASSSSSSPTCNDTLGTPQNTGLPCGSGNVQQSGTSQSAALTLGLAGLSLGSTSVATVASAPVSSNVFTDRRTSPLATECTTMPLPPPTNDGCVHTDAKRSLGTVTLGAMPALFVSNLPLGTKWGTGANNFLVQLSNYSDAVSAESGIGAAAPCAKQASTCSGTASGSLTYWTGIGTTGYATASVNWGATPPNITIPPVNFNTLVGGAVVNVSMTNTLTFGTTSTSTSGTAPCRVIECKATAQATSPIQGDIIYTVSVAGATVANVDINVNLGTLTVQTNYKAAPLAG